MKRSAKALRASASSFCNFRNHVHGKPRDWSPSIVRSVTAGNVMIACAVTTLVWLRRGPSSAWRHPLAQQGAPDFPLIADFVRSAGSMARPLSPPAGRGLFLGLNPMSGAMPLDTRTPRLNQHLLPPPNRLFDESRDRRHARHARPFRVHHQIDRALGGRPRFVHRLETRIA